MRFPVLLVALGLLAIGSRGEGKRKRKFDGDFEFAEEDEIKSTKSSGEKKRWIHDPTSDLCRPLNCKKKEMCLLEDAFTAVCVSKKELQKNGDVVVPKSPSPIDDKKRLEDVEDDVFYDTEDDPDDETEEEDLGDSVGCKPCPVVKPTFLCGSDNRTYSSLCRLDYHNCIHHTNIRVACKGFCPCKASESDARLRKKQRQQERLNSFMNKYKATLDKSGTGGGSIAGGKPAPPSDVYTFTPQDFKYENKHYKYIKYTKYNKENGFLYADDKQKMYNEVLDDKVYGNDVGMVPATPPGKECSSSGLQSIGNRLLDWFSVIMADSSKKRKPRNGKSKGLAIYFPAACKGEVRWMFQHLDLNGDGRLSLQELYDLEHDQNEVCLKPFLQQCDLNRDLVVAPNEWCRCFQRTERPCAAVKRKIGSDLLGAYVPECDSRGYYKPTQCHGAIGMCWCVDEHGVEFANTRTHAKPNCDALVGRADGGGGADAIKHQVLQVQDRDRADDEDDERDEEDDDDDDGQDVEGSADRPDNY